MRRVTGIIAVIAALLAPWPEEGKAAGPRQADSIAMQWSLVRAYDKATGRRHCTVVSFGGDLSATLSEGDGSEPATWSVRVGFDNQPGSLRYLRIGRAIFTSDQPAFRGDQAGEIIARLSAPGEFTFEWARRPDFAKRQGLFATGDFAAGAAECVDWISGSRI